MRLKKITRWMLWFILALCLNVVPVWAHDEAPAPVHITLLQLNDVYQISPVDHGKNGGLARVATLVRQIERQNPNTFLVLAGDTLSPSIASRLFQGRQMIDLWNRLGLDVAVLGNHEFDFGNDVLLQRMKESQFQWVNANVVDQATGKPFGTSVPYWVKEIQGVKIGFFGLLTPDTKDSSHPGKNVSFQDPLRSARRALHALQHEGADVVVAVTHLPMNEDKQLARSFPLRMAVIMGGHEHTLLQSVAGGTPIYKMGSDARNLGRIDLWVDPQTRQLQSLDFEAIPVNADIAEDPDVAAVVKNYEEQIDAALGKTIGQTAVALDARQQTNRSQETNLGDWVTDVYRQRMNADIALINGGSIRSNTTIGPGPLTRRELLSVFPFSNTVVKVQVSGQQIRQALEHGVSRLNDEEAGRFPQVSGLRFSYDGRKPAGSRVVKITVNGHPLKDRKSYTLTSSAYLIGGGDGYNMFKDSRYLVSPEAAPLETDMLEDALRAAKTIAPKTDGRIQRIDAP
jgi:5'-nucleotidase